MVFSSISFLFVFLPALLLVYFLIPSKYRSGRNLVLLIFSLFFYAYGGPRFLILMLVSIALNYVGGLLCAPSFQWRRAALWITVAINLGLLGWFKYATFLAENLSKLWTGLPVPEITLPIGISFFTFQGISYVLDVYRGDAQAERNPLRIALYISLFPQLVAGPIVRYTTVCGGAAPAQGDSGGLFGRRGPIPVRAGEKNAAGQFPWAYRRRCLRTRAPDPFGQSGLAGCIGLYRSNLF